jgi:hypothetical protein
MIQQIVAWRNGVEHLLNALSSCVRRGVGLANGPGSCGYLTHARAPIAFISASIASAAAVSSSSVTS